MKFCYTCQKKVLYDEHSRVQRVLYALMNSTDEKFSNIGQTSQLNLVHCSGPEEEFIHAIPVTCSECLVKGIDDLVKEEEDPQETR